ncbi:MAG TPA: YjbQ family protein [Planctomycetes bacterium]|nr:YjbQ family protein [Planctomycetota bacterium]
MRGHRDRIVIDTQGRGTTDLTQQVQSVVGHSGVATGLCHVFCLHTSASLILCENADPSVREDLERFLADAVPDGSPLFKHMSEGPDDMPAHVRSILTSSSVTLPVEHGRLLLGTWQGLYLYEHRVGSHRRRLILTVTGLDD